MKRTHFDDTVLDPRRSRRRPRVVAVTLGALAVISLAGCGLQPSTAYVPGVEPASIERIDDLPAGAHVTVTSKDFTEQLVLGKIGVIAAKAAGFDVTDETNVPGSVAVRQLMLDGGADMTYEYTGTAWLSFMGHSDPIRDPEEQYVAVRDQDEQNGLSWLRPAPMNNTYAFAVRSEAVDGLDGITRLSQVKDLPKAERTFCVESEFYSRPDGFKPMLEKYGLQLGGGANGVPRDNVSILDTGTVYTATDRGKCNFGEVFTTDGRIKALGLSVLDDDGQFFPNYNVSPVLNTATLKTYPQLQDVYDQISPKLTDAVLQELNRQVDVEGREPADVALDWMVDEGFVKRP
ncbi:glycine betaine ABC transporter substrate-binding protein [Curtobacterium luteum]|uniref:Glycine/betaine ABC transporter substrate-binding protein n=1 Tax=Curtobacterium luteum TaxID=33881 RepID=A0A175RSK2_9MICO|nr:glycine betaine ABC transporter substrate-binding protein [Curtobacterium luteum]KTR06477.1 glycine/betaine ABC transporter substrate-binding protein [Curtobacterium luteum]